jgi:transcription initiation factor TFIIIB Brf1 subunit/transcription initiation factor TFIIB
MICNRCGIDKPSTDFYTGRRICKACKCKQTKENYQKNKEYFQAYGRQYYKENKEQLTRYNKKNTIRKIQIILNNIIKSIKKSLENITNNIEKLIETN